MWICQRCHSENRDAASACEACGAPRAAGRFASAPTMQRPGRTAQPPQVTSPGSAVEKQSSGAASRSEYQLPEFPPRKRRRGPLAAFARFAGAALLILLPLLTAGLAVRQYDVLSSVLLPLILNEKAPAWMALACYLLAALCAVLLSMLPGLWTLLLARKDEK